MSREEAISLIKSAQLMLVNPTTNEPVSDLYEALDMAIKALKQKSCIDAVSREEAIMCLTGINLPTDTDELIALYHKRLKALPPVIPKRNLEAWDKIIEEIEQLRARFKESGGVYEHSVYGLDYATEIINKHLNKEAPPVTPKREENTVSEEVYTEEYTRRKALEYENYVLKQNMQALK